ncbi:MAG: FkbM family methyltransferase [Sphingomonas sp.]
MSQAMLSARRVVGRAVTRAWVGKAAAFLLRDKIPHRGLVIDTSDPVVSPTIKAALLARAYESGEYRFVRAYLPRDCDVIELGGSLGVISCTVRKHIAPSRRQIVVEADPRLARVLRGNLARNGCDANIEVVETAISYDGGDTVSFALGETSVSGRIAEPGSLLSTIEVPATTLQQLADRFALRDFTLVSDIEGVEWQVVENDLDTLKRARILIMELHDRAGHGSYQDLLAKLLATGAFDLLDQHGPVVVLRPRPVS